MAVPLGKYNYGQVPTTIEKPSPDDVVLRVSSLNSAPIAKNLAVKIVVFCGMAGSFGYEKEHYEVSMAIGGRRLFPAITRDLDTLVVAPGVSCREQIEHATGRRALHPAEALRNAL